MFSMSQQPDEKWEEDRRWLQGLQDVDLPPVDHLLDECLKQPIQEQVRHSNGTCTLKTDTCCAVVQTKRGITQRCLACLAGE